jgi:hypothetical protein
MPAGGVVPNCPAAAGASLCVLVPSVKGLCPLSCETCTCTKSCPPEEDKNLLCDEKEMRDNLAAFLSACDGARDCSGQCKEAFETKYAGCVRGYVPLLVEGGFKNATLKRIVDLCAQNDRATPLLLHIEALVEAGALWSPLQLAALEFAVDVATHDPQLFKGFSPQVTYDVFNSGSKDGSSSYNGEEGVDAVANVVLHGTESTNIILGACSSLGISPKLPYLG